MARARTIVRVSRRFSADNGLTTAGALSFYFLLSILPMSLLTLSVLGFVLGSEKAAVSAVTTLGKIQRIFPEGTLDVRSTLSALVFGRGVLGGLGLVLLLWFSGGVFFTVEVAVNRIFRTGKKRGFFHRTAVVYFFMLFAGALLVASIASTFLAVIVSNLSLSIFGINPAKIPLAWDLFFELVPPMLIMLLFAIIYKVGPTSRVPWGSAFKGAICGAVLWELSRRILGWYLSTLSLYHKLYGALGTLVAIFIWLFYSANIFLIGAEYAAISNERKEKKTMLEIDRRAE